MSLRLVIGIAFLLIGCIWTMRRPFIGVLMVIILFHVNPRVYGTGLEDIRFQFFATIVLLISFVINQKDLKRFPTPMLPPMKLMMAFMAVVFLTSIWAVSSQTRALESTFEFSKIVLFSYLITKIVQTEKEVKTLLWTILGSVWYTAFMARWGVEWDIIDEVEMGIATGGTGTHFIMFIPLLITFILVGSKWERRLSFLIIPFILDATTVLPSGFRSTFLSLVTAVFFYVIFAPGKVRMRSILPFAAAGILFVYFLAPPGYFEYMRTILDPASESSANSRSIINEASFKILKEYPLGVGYNNYSRISMQYLPEDVLTDQGTRDAHNSYLKVATEFGIFGFVVWMLLFFVTFYYFHKVRRNVPRGEPPSPMQQYAFSLQIGLCSVILGIYTHSYNDLDTLYWFVALSCVMHNIYFREPEENKDVELEKQKQIPGLTPPKLPPIAKPPKPVGVGR